jgi:hypothetical protein
LICDGGTALTPLVLTGILNVSYNAITVNLGAYLNMAAAIAISMSGSACIENRGTIVGNCIGIGANTGASTNEGIYNVGTITGNCLGIALTSGPGINNGSTITGNCIGISMDSNGVAGTGTISGIVIGVTNLTYMDPVAITGHIHYPGTTEATSTLDVTNSTQRMQVYSDHNVTNAGVYDGSNHQHSGFWSASTGTPVSVTAANVLSTVTSPNAGTYVAIAQADARLKANAYYGVSSATNGTAYIPVATDVRDGVHVDATHGSCHVPAAADVRSGVDVDATVGSCHVPTAAQTLTGVEVDATVGTLYSASHTKLKIADIIEGVDSSETAATIWSITE